MSQSKFSGTRTKKITIAETKRADVSGEHGVVTERKSTSIVLQ
jgi:hypothetical protein